MLPPQISRERRGEEDGRRALEEIDKNTAEGIRNQGERIKGEENGPGNHRRRREDQGSGRGRDDGGSVVGGERLEPKVVIQAERPRAGVLAALAPATGGGGGGALLAGRMLLSLPSVLRRQRRRWATGAGMALSRGPGASSFFTGSPRKGRREPFEEQQRRGGPEDRKAGRFFASESFVLNR